MKVLQLKVCIAIYPLSFDIVVRFLLLLLSSPLKPFRSLPSTFICPSDHTLGRSIPAVTDGKRRLIATIVLGVGYSHLEAPHQLVDHSPLPHDLSWW